MSKSSTPSTTFYYAKDIQFLLHEPLLSRFRDQKALSKKIAKALGRNEVSDAARWERDLKPRMRLDHVIKERYPTFVDALRELDDALSMLFLFANLPSTAEVPAGVVAKCQRLTAEFEHYLIRTHSLRKSFLSIKGIYYQATVQGQDILWLVPYRFVQRTGADVDFRIMATFVEFYTTLLGFVNFRLYTTLGLVYPPKFNAKSEEQGAELEAFRLEYQRNEQHLISEKEETGEIDRDAQAEADRLLALPANDQQGVTDSAPETSDQITTTLDTFVPIDENADTLMQPSATADAAMAGQLFQRFTFFLSRETPRHPLEFILKAFGCRRVGWDSVTGEPGSYCSEGDARITHQIVDRPNLPLPHPPATDGEADHDDGTAVQKSQQRVLGRIYVQPQWVWDSINAGQLQRVDLYAPGATLPPHLSPWVKPKKGDYDPSVPLSATDGGTVVQDSEDEMENGADDIDGSVSGSEDNDSTLEAAPGGQNGEMEVKLAESDDCSDNESEGRSNKDDESRNEWGGFSSGEDEAEPYPVRHHQAELEAEVLGKRVDNSSTSKAATKRARGLAQAQSDKKVQEDLERRKMMMPRRKRKMYDKMVYSNAKKEEETEKLKSKRRKIEKAQAKAPM